jgi:hypothetical protein
MPGGGLSPRRKLRSSVAMAKVNGNRRSRELTGAAGDAGLPHFLFRIERGTRWTV